jgi:hypothetical protein
MERIRATDLVSAHPPQVAAYVHRLYILLAGCLYRCLLRFLLYASNWIVKGLPVVVIQSVDVTLLLFSQQPWRYIAHNWSDALILSFCQGHRRWGAMHGTVLA